MKMSILCSFHASLKSFMLAFVYTHTDGGGHAFCRMATYIIYSRRCVFHVLHLEYPVYGASE